MSQSQEEETSQKQHQEPSQASDVSMKEPQEKKLNAEPKDQQQEELQVASQNNSGEVPVEVTEVKGEAEGEKQTEAPEDSDGTSIKVADNTEQKESKTSGEEAKTETPSKVAAEKPERSKEDTAVQLETSAEEKWTEQNLFDDQVWKQERQTNRVKIVVPTDPLPVLFVFAGPPEECIWTDETKAWHPLMKKSGKWCQTYTNLQNSAREANLDLNRVYMVDAWPYKVWRPSTEIDEQDIARAKAWIYEVAVSLKIRIVVLFHSQLRLCMKRSSGSLCGLENDQFVWIATRHPSQQSMARESQRKDLNNALTRVRDALAKEELLDILEEFQSYSFSGRNPENVVDLFNFTSEEIKTKELYELARIRTPELVKNAVTSESKNITPDSFRFWLNANASKFVTLQGNCWVLTAEGKRIKIGLDTDSLEDALGDLKI